MNCFLNIIRFGDGKREIDLLKSRTPSAVDEAGQHTYAGRPFCQTSPSAPVFAAVNSTPLKSSRQRFLQISRNTTIKPIIGNHLYGDTVLKASLEELAGQWDRCRDPRHAGCAMVCGIVEEASSWLNSSACGQIDRDRILATTQPQQHLYL